MDLTIPGGVDGKEAIKHLMEIDPHVKAIVSSGYANDPVMADYRQYGFCGVVVKPFRMVELTEVLHQVLTSPTR
jgi:CheY-like chemotaxis protein